MRRVFIGLSLLIFLFSCNGRQPGGILSKEKMAALMVDIHLVDGYLTTIHTDSAIKYIDSYYEGVYQNHGVDSALFMKNLTYYAQHPQDFDKIYTLVNEQMDAYNAKSEIQLNANFDEQRVLDSIAVKKQQDSIWFRRRDSLQWEGMKDYLKFSALDSSMRTQMAINPFTSSEWQLQILGLKLPQPYPQGMKSFMDPSEIPIIPPRPVPLPSQQKVTSPLQPPLP